MRGHEVTATGDQARWYDLPVLPNVRDTARWALASLVALEVTGAALRHRTRTTRFLEAQRQALLLGRPLVVVGDPDAGAHTSLIRAYGCGDVCLDLRGCPACPVAHRMDLSRDLAPVSSDSAVVYASCVLEYVPDPDAAWRELVRMAGTADRVHLVEVQSWTATSVYYPGARWIVRREGRGAPTFERISAARVTAWAAPIAALGTAALIAPRSPES